MIPANPTETNVTPAQATLTWDAVSGAWGYRVRHKSTGGWTIDTVNTNSLTITSLSSGTTYRWQVKSMCDSLGFNSSVWTTQQLFTTATCNISLSTSLTDVLCNGGSSGAVDLTATGGSGSYTYLWSTGATSEDISSLSAGSYSVTVTDTWGCTATTTVTIGESAAITSSNTQTICDGQSITIGSNTYTTAGIYTDVLTASNGCDSTVTTTLVVNVATTSTSSATACDTYTWNGTAYTSSGTYTYTTTNAAGCDSTATLNLTINNTVTYTNTQIVCFGSSYTIGSNTCLLYTSPSPRD